MDEESTYVSALTWVSRGFARAVPRQVEMTEEEVKQMKSLPAVKRNLNKNIEDLNRIDIEEENDMPAFTSQVNQMDDDAGDENYPFGFEDLSDQQKQDYYIKPEDILIVAGKIEKEFSSLEVYIYEQDRNNLFVHHEVMLSAFPLSVKWLNVNMGSFHGTHAEKGNYAIVSTFLPQIDIWDLDLQNAVEPQFSLGGEVGVSSSKPKKFKNKAKKYKPGSHTDSVLSLSMNPFYKHVLASGSADQSFKIWDLSKQQSVFTNSTFDSIVSHVQWSPVESSIILTTSEDNNLRIFDSRFQSEAPILHKLHQKQRIQGVSWNVNQPHQVVYATDTGYLNMIDARHTSKYVFRFEASDKPLTDTKVTKRNMAATCGEDGFVNIYDINQSTEQGKPLHLGTQSSKSGKLFCMQFFQDSQVLSCGNSTGSMFVWDTYANKKIEEHFSQYK